MNTVMDDRAAIVLVCEFLVMGSAFFAALTWLGELARTGPDIGTMIVFDPKRTTSLAGAGNSRVSGPHRMTAGDRRAWVHPHAVGHGGHRRKHRDRSENNGLSRHVPVFTGPANGHDPGAGDCGNSADLILRLDQVRALARTAGGYGIHHWVGMF